MSAEKTFKTVPLKYPIPVPKNGGGTVEVSSLQVGRLKAKHLRALPSSFVEREGKVEPAELIPLIAALVDLPESSIDEMDIEDLATFAENLENFLERSLITGKK
jgi:hypothetical protein